MDYPSTSRIVWLVCLEDGRIVGHVCVSDIQGLAWAHDLKFWGEDASAVLKMIKTMERMSAERGVDSLTITVEDPRLVDVYTALRYERQSLVMRKTISRED